MNIKGKATVRIGNLEYEVKDLVLEAYSEEIQAQVDRIARQSGYSSFTIEAHRTSLRHRLKTPKLNRYFEEVRVPWDVLKAKSKLKRG